MSEVPLYWCQLPQASSRADLSHHRIGLVSPSNLRFEGEASHLRMTTREALTGGLIKLEGFQYKRMVMELTEEDSFDGIFQKASSVGFRAHQQPITFLCGGIPTLDVTVVNQMLTTGKCTRSCTSRHKLTATLREVDFWNRLPSGLA